MREIYVETFSMHHCNDYSENEGISSIERTFRYSPCADRSEIAFDRQDCPCTSLPKDMEAQM
ncbi:hypothetical protein B0E50_09505 [Rhodanobacter sp. C01]|nr:hypothetical protein B0E50_09505 [Rhodanobacter sp. C01]